MVFQPIAFGQNYQTYHTTLILKPIPHAIQQGHSLTFAGILLTLDDKTPLPNRMIFIQHDSPYVGTRTIARAITDSDGNFAVNWTVKPKDSGARIYNIFAKFNGDDNDFWSISKQFEFNVITSSVKN